MFALRSLNGHPSRVHPNELAVFNWRVCFGFTLSKGLNSGFILQFSTFAPYFPSFEDQANWEGQGKFKDKTVPILYLKKIQNNNEKATASW